MTMLSEIGLEICFSRESLKATILMSLLSMWVLVGLFVFLNRYTKRRYFTIWTTAWMFYIVWLTLMLTSVGASETQLLIMFKQWCLATVAVFLLWGSGRFLGIRIRQVGLGLFLAFLWLWSYGAIYYFNFSPYSQITLYGLIGMSSILASWCFFRYRRRRHYIGAGLISAGFLLWGLYFSSIPAFQANPDLTSVGFFISAILQLYIAVSMIILVLEEVRETHTTAIRTIQSCRDEQDALRVKMESTEERYRNLFEHASEAIVIATANTELRIIELNDRAERLLGINRAEAYRQSLLTFCQFQENSPLISENQAQWPAELSRSRHLNLIRRNGSAIPAELSGAPVDFRGQPAFQFFLREVTDRARLEQQLRQAEKLSALGQMISGVAHELNNPLAVIKGYIDLILAYHELNPQTRTDLDKVTKECTRAIKLVRNFLAFAREQPAHREMVNINEIITRIADLHRFEFQIAKIKLILNLSPSLPQTHADPDQVQQLIINLVSNAIQAMAEIPAARVLSISTEPKNGELLLIRIEDSGPGVPAELENRIFEPFFTTKPVGTGTGLGLSIAHSILSDHHGRIFYQKSTFGGAAFVLEFPVVAGIPTHSEIEQLDASPKRVSRSGADVLVLDDEKAIAEMVCEMLKVLGHEPVLCLSANNALKLLDERHFDLIISDFRMPVMNGEEFYRRVLEKTPGLADRIIFLTGDVVNRDTQSFLKSIGNPRLSKPFQLNHLEKAVSDALAEENLSRRSGSGSPSIPAPTPNS